MVLEKISPKWGKGFIGFYWNSCWLTEVIRSVFVVCLLKKTMVLIIGSLSLLFYLNRQLYDIAYLQDKSV